MGDIHLDGVLVDSIAANGAGIFCYVALNNSQLARSDFKGIIPEDRIFEKTGLLTKVLCK